MNLIAGLADADCALALLYGKLTVSILLVTAQSKFALSSRKPLLPFLLESERSEPEEYVTTRKVNSV